MSLSDIVGQPRAVALLQGTLARGRVSHAYLFAGPAGVGKEACAAAFVQALVCSAAGDDACGRCDGCRRAEKRCHPDVIWVFTETELLARRLAGRADLDGAPSREIKIAQVRELKARLALTRLVAPRKAAVVVDADRLNPSGQNALLKLLEEPPPHATLLLVTSGPDALLPTVRSRCTRVPFGPLPVAAVADRVARERGVSAEAALLRARLAGGNLTRALDLGDDGLERRREVVVALDEIGGDARAALAFAERFADDRDAALEALEAGAVWFRDVAVAAAHGGDVGAERLANTDLADRAAAAGRRLGLGEALRRHDLCRAAQGLIDERHANARLQVESAVLRMIGA